MRIKTFVVGPIQTNCYLVIDETSREALVIDPDLREPEEIERVRGELNRSGSILKYVVNTHGHADHISGNARIKEETGALILAHEMDAGLMAEPWPAARAVGRIFPVCPFCGGKEPDLAVREDKTRARLVCSDCGFQFEFIASPAADRSLVDGDVIKLGRIEIRIIHTPGHTPGGIALYIKEERALFSGDTLFKGSIGRTDLPGGSFPDIVKSLEKLSVLPGETAVYPGHGESTTIAQETRDNPYLQKPGE